MTGNDGIAREIAVMHSSHESLVKVIDGLRWFHGQSFDPEVHQYVVAALSEALVGVMGVLDAMHANVPTSSVELQYSALSAIDRALLKSEGEL